MSDQIRAVHRRSGGFRHIGKASPAIVERVKRVLADLLLIEPTP
ncbi:MAG: hypothetical protein AAF253_11600 [Pseudomonadota bacterium]